MGASDGGDARARVGFAGDVELALGEVVQIEGSRVVRVLAVIEEIFEIRIIVFASRCHGAFDAFAVVY